MPLRPTVCGCTGELYGGGSTTIVLLPPNPISHSRIWKAQLHYLARHHRVVVYDGRGNGNSDSPDPSGPWLEGWGASDCLAVRDRSIFIADPVDVVPEQLGPDLPPIRDWTQEHIQFAGYVTGWDAGEIADRDGLRAELGYGPDEKICIVAAGGSGVGTHLVERAVAAFPDAKRRVPELRMIVVTGPRIDPDSLPHGDGLETNGYVHKLYRQLAACDVAISHGGLSTTMELTAAGRPFLYFPLRQHFEQNHHVHHRLERHGAGRRMDFDDSPPDAIAAAIGEEIGRDVDYRPVADGGAARAAGLIAEVL